MVQEEHFYIQGRHWVEVAYVDGRQDGVVAGGFWVVIGIHVELKSWKPKWQDMHAEFAQTLQGRAQIFMHVESAARV